MNVLASLRHPRTLAQAVLATATLIMGLGFVRPASAAERLTLRVGPFEQSVEVADLEQFAKTGTVPAALQLYTPFLTPDLRKALNSRLDLDPQVGEKVVGDLLSSPSGKQLLQSLQVAVPGITVEQLEAGFTLAARQANGLDAISVIRAIPQDRLTVDVTQAIAVATKVNLSYLKTQALSPMLERDLAVPTSPFRPKFDPAAPGSDNVQQQTLFLQDTQRHRSLPTDIYWSANAQGPLVVISPGFEANRRFLAYLARHLASHGLTVVAMEHPSVGAYNHLPISGNPGDLIPAREFIDRPQDVSFVLDALEKLNQQAGPLQGKLNTQQVSLIGHSLGGYTVLALAGAELNLDDLRQFCQQTSPLERSAADWLQCAAMGLPDHRLNLRDRRVAQVIALNPVTGALFGSDGVAQITVPTLILSATNDTLAPALSQQIRPFSQLHSSKYLVTAIGGTHLSVSDPVDFSGALAQSSLVPERRGKEADPLRELLRGVSLAFIKQLTPDAQTYQPFLTAAYAQSLSTSSLPLRLNTELPASLNPWLAIATHLGKEL